MESLFLVRLYSARSLVVVPFLSLVLRSVDLGAASLRNRQCSPWCQSSRLRAFSRLRALGCDETVPQCVSSLYGRLDFGWGVLFFGSRNRWSVLDSRVVFSPRTQLTIDTTTGLPSLHPDNVFDGLPMLSSSVCHVQANEPYNICNIPRCVGYLSARVSAMFIWLPLGERF